MNRLIGPLLCFALNVLVLAEVWLAFKGDMLFPSQFKNLNGKPCIPLFGHLGIWGDFFFLSVFCGFAAAFYGSQWSEWQVMKSAIIAIAVTAFFHWLWSKNPFPNCLAWNNELTPAGWVHAMYMAITLTIVILFYFQTTGITREVAAFVSVALAVHMTAGTQLFTYFASPWWCKELPLKDWVHCLCVNALIWTFLYWRYATMVLVPK